MSGRSNDLTAPAEPTDAVRAAGGVLWRANEVGEIEISVIHRPHRHDWSLPKGKVDPGESETEAALREVVEETGIRGRLGRGLGTICYQDERGNPPRPKVVRYWAVEAIEGLFRPSAEVDELRWVTISEARRLLTHDRDREVVDRFAAAPASVATLLLVRHAEAVDLRSWSGDDRTRPLTARGERRAAAMARALVGFDVQAIVTSSAARCVACAALLAEATGRRAVIEKRLTEKGYAASSGSVIGWLGRLTAAGAAVAAYSHAPVISDLLRRFAVAPRAPAAPAQGAAWALSLHGERPVHAEQLTAADAE